MQIIIAKDGEQLGPYDETQLKEMVEAGTIALTDLAWRDGLTDWIPVATIIAPLEARTDSPPVVSTQISPPRLDENLAGRGARLGAVLLDLLALAVCLLPGLVVIWSDGNDETTVTAGVVVCAIGFIALAALQLVWLTSRGQTIGKRVLGIRIVKYADDSLPGFLHAVVYRAILPGMISNIPLVGPVFGLVDICFIFSEERRCLHDLFASTKVINA
ncbi:MAG TPA: RDD family protein [Chthoniobacterales bacterium]|jgi:uncharacterized RDD family membrane protein YckC|nr:RDD family protein [Chthoniobacterales bacterium]